MPNVVYFNSTMSGAPSLNNAVNTAIGVLDACLVDGFGSVTVDSLVVASDVATVTVSSGHQFAMVGNTGPVIRISGANPPALNADWRVTVTSSTVFTFATTGITDQTATGTISAKRAPAGFSKAFSGTNKAAYRSDDVTGNRHYLRVDDSIGANARVRGFETMSDVDTGTGPFPTDAQISGGLYLGKSNSATVRAWFLISDGLMVYFMADYTGSWSNGTGGFIFGDPVPYRTPDAYATVMIAGTSTGAQTECQRLFNTSGSYVARAVSQLGASQSQYRCSHRATDASLGNGANLQAYPSPADNAVHLWPVESWDGTVLAARGVMPGVWNPLHAGNPPHLTVIEDIPQLPGRTLLTLHGWNSNNKVCFDLTGPWR